MSIDEQKTASILKKHHAENVRPDSRVPIAELPGLTFHVINPLHAAGIYFVEQLQAMDMDAIARIVHGPRKMAALAQALDRTEEYERWAGNANIEVHDENGNVVAVYNTARLRQFASLSSTAKNFGFESGRDLIAAIHHGQRLNPTTNEYEPFGWEDIARYRWEVDQRNLREQMLRQRELDNLKTRVEQLKEENTTLQARIKELQGTLREERANHKHALEEERQQSKRNYTQLETDFRHYRQEAEAKIQGLERENRRLRTELDKANEQVLAWKKKQEELRAQQNVMSISEIDQEQYEAEIEQKLAEFSKDYDIAFFTQMDWMNLRILAMLKVRAQKLLKMISGLTSDMSAETIDLTSRLTSEVTKLMQESRQLEDVLGVSQKARQARRDAANPADLYMEFIAAAKEFMAKEATIFVCPNCSLDREGIRLAIFVPHFPRHILTEKISLVCPRCGKGFSQRLVTDHQLAGYIEARDFKPSDMPPDILEALPEMQDPIYKSEGQK